MPLPTSVACHSVNLFYLHGDFTAVAAPPAQFAVVPVPPGPDHVVVCETQSLSVSAATGNIDHPVTLQSVNLQETQTETVRSSQLINSKITMLVKS